MHTINVNLQSIQDLSYQIFIGKGILSKFDELVNIDKYSKIIIIADKAIRETALPQLKSGIKRETAEIVIDATEETKNLFVAEEICKKLLKAGADRQSLILNLGGGVLGDVGGFAASIYMRGIPFIQIPTTLLSQVDASVGGKTGVNFDGIKNILGSIQQPVAVVIDTQTLVTLSDRETLAGFAEILKHAFIADADYLLLLSSRETLTLDNVIKRSCEIKAAVVSADAKETGKRKILNFGHTFGHAFEALSHATKNPLSHGEAVAIGMRAEAKLSCLMGMLKEEELNTIEKHLICFQLPLTVNFDIDFPSVLDLIKADKKNTHGDINWTLLNKVGECFVDQKAPLEKVEQAFRYVCPQSHSMKFDA